MSDDTLSLYRQTFAEESERDDPDRVVRQTARLWNKVVAWTITAALVLIVLYLLLTTVTS